jgi:hypothetical protein
VQWSDIDGITTWTAGTGFSNYVDLPDGGIVRGVAGGEFGLIFQESVVRRFTYVPGATPAFQIERITEELGLLGPFSIIRAAGACSLCRSRASTNTARRAHATSARKRVDRTFLADIDLSNELQLLIGASDPASTRVWWAIVTSASNATFQKILIYDYALERWSPPISVSGEYLAAIVKPGMTLESVDTLGGEQSRPSDLIVRCHPVRVVLAHVGGRCQSQAGIFDGANVEAIVETSERSVSGKRVRVRGLGHAPTPRRSTALYAIAPMRNRSWRRHRKRWSTAHGICPQNIDCKLASGQDADSSGHAVDQRHGRRA